MNEPLSLTEHLEELRRRLLICIGAVAIGGAAGFVLAGRIIAWLKQPAGPTLGALAFFDPTEALLAYLRVAVSSGIALAMPVILGQTWGFVRPGLTPREQRWGVIFVGWGSGMFLLGAAFGYAVLLPAGLRFLLSFGAPTLVPIISIDRYLSFTLSVLLACGVVFELPVVLWCLTQLGVVRPAWLRRQWRVALVVLLCAAAVVTPTTDIATMTLLAIPLIGLYALSVLIAGWAAPADAPRNPP